MDNLGRRRERAAADISACAGEVAIHPAVADRRSPARQALMADAFEGLPSGVLVTDGGKRLVAANRAARELLHVRIPDGTAPACCLLLGCGAPGTPLENECLTDLALEAGGALPEIRVDLTHDGPTGALWITASPLGPDSSHAVLELRRGERSDRRRRTEPHWMGEPRLRIKVLGRTAVESAEGSIGGSWIERRPGQLLKYLITEREHPTPGDQIAAALWPGKGVEALNTVRHYVHVLREKLEPGRAKRSESLFVVAVPSGYFIDRLRVEIDADVFEEKARTGMASYLDGDHAAGAIRLEEAIRLYAGDFVADEPYAEWALPERDRLRALAGQACRALIEHRARLGDLDAAADHGQRLAELEPYDMEVQRAILVIALKRGRRSEAVRRYGIVRQRMLSEFGEDMAFDLAELGRTRDEPIRLI